MISVISPSISGLLLINKPSGPTSYDMIRWARRKIKNTKLGHAGTLDPLASGLIILLVGKATKSQARIMGHDKTYLCTMQMGTQTDTGDIQGKVIQDSDVPPLSEGNIQKTFGEFLGEQSQIPPMFSALKVGGQPLYKLARKGQVVPRQPRKIVVHALDLISFDSPNKVQFRLTCSSGTYVRSLVEDLAVKWNTVATVTQLARETIGPYSVDNAVDGEELLEWDLDQIERRIMTLDVMA